MKKIILYCLIFLASYLHLQGQNKTKKIEQETVEYLKEQDYQSALRSLDELLKTSADTVRILEQRAFVFGKLHQYAAAISDAKKLVALFPVNSGYYNNLGWYLMLNKQYGEAKKYCEKAIKLNPEDFKTYLNLAHIYAYLKNIKKAFYYYQYAGEYLPNETALDDVLEDFTFLNKEHNYPYDTTVFTSFFRNSFADYRVHVAADKILDSIYLLSLQGKPVNALKRKFIEEEKRNKTWRYFVVGKFLWDIGVEEYENKNMTRASENYFAPSLQMASTVKDTLAKIERVIQYSKLIEAREGMPFLHTALLLANTTHEVQQQFVCYVELNDAHKRLYQWDSCLYYSKLALQQAVAFNDDEWKYAAAVRLQENYGVKKQFDSVLVYYNFVRSYQEKNNIPVADRYNTDYKYLLSLYKTGQLKNCIEQGEKTWLRYKPFESDIDISEISEVIGMAYFASEDLQKAENYLWKSITGYKEFLKRNIEKHTPGLLNIEREPALKTLKKIYFQKQNAGKLFDVLEESKANLLYTTLSKSKVAGQTVSLLQVQHNLKEDEAAISFASSGRIDEGYAVAFDKKNIIINAETLQRADKAFLAPGAQRLKQNVMPMVEAVAKKTGNASVVQKTTSLLVMLTIFQTAFIGRYNGPTRGVIEDNDTSAGMAEKIKAMNDVLYELYVEPFESIIAGKKTIYISAETLTSYLSFESLKNKKGKYLAELYNIIYVPSFTIAQLLKQKEEISNNKMLAIGNPSYSTFKPLEMNGLGYDLAQLGFKSWADLPGTEAELKKIKNIVPDITVLQKDDVTESKIYQLDNAGALKEYKYLHFALHGITNLDNYEDNSIIVTEKPGTDDDGFLLFNEIAGISLNARLVCLSACETAVVSYAINNDLNLASAFILAGARSVIASSWRIDDEATGLFMTELYENIFKKQQSIPGALHTTRLKFIKGEFGDTYRSPSYWAAFKYVGY